MNAVGYRDKALVPDLKVSTAECRELHIMYNYPPSEAVGRGSRNGFMAEGTLELGFDGRVCFMHVRMLRFCMNFSTLW